MIWLSSILTYFIISSNQGDYLVFFAAILLLFPFKYTCERLKKGRWMPLNNSGPNFILLFECPNYNFYHKLNLIWSACRLALSWVYDKSTNHLTRIDIPAFKINLKFKINLFPIYLIFLYYYFQNLSSWKDRRRKQSEEALMRVAEVKALESEGDDYNQQKKR